MRLDYSYTIVVRTIMMLGDRFITPDSHTYTHTHTHTHTHTDTHTHTHTHTHNGTPLMRTPLGP